MILTEMRNSANTKGLMQLINSLPSELTMAEIGCYIGDSTKFFMESGKVKICYAIDIWNDDLKIFETLFGKEHDFTLVEHTFDKNLDGFNIVKLKMTLQEAANQLPALDFVYIDANHEYEYVIEDIKTAVKKLKPTGIISGHDYHPATPGVIKAVNEIFGKPDKVFSDGSWIVNLK